MVSSYQIDLPVFSGPLDLLLHLIESQELDITSISLALVTEQYLEQFDGLKNSRSTYLIDFLVIGARLLLIKSRALLPQPPIALAEHEEEDLAAALIRQLKEYKRFKSAAGWLGIRQEMGWRTYLRLAPPPKLDGKLDLSGVTVVTLLAAMQRALQRVQGQSEKLAAAVSLSQGRLFTLEGQIMVLRKQVDRHGRARFHELLSEQATRSEISLTFLAVLELIKRQQITAHQPLAFGPIEIFATEAAPKPQKHPDSQ